MACRATRAHPEQTLLNQLVAQHYRAFLAHLTEQGWTLPEYLRREFDEFLQCGPVLDGLYVLDTDAGEAVEFRRVKTPSHDDLGALLERISQQVGRYLEHAGLLVSDIEISYPTLESSQTVAMDDWLGPCKLM